MASTSSSSTDDEVDLTFPTTSNPSPFDIFHVPRTRSLDADLLKSRWHALAKRYHPDLSRSSNGGRDTTREFKAIKDAYETLSDPVRRGALLHDPRQGPAVSFARGGSRPHTPSHMRPAYPSGAWDWANDPFSARYSPDGTGHTAGWDSKGHYAKNGHLFMALASVMVVVTPLTYWWALPPELFNSRVSSVVDEFTSSSGASAAATPPSSGFMPHNYRDRRHAAAQKELQTARAEAKKDGPAKRLALKKRLRQLEEEKAIERALEVERVAADGKGTGHL